MQNIDAALIQMDEAASAGVRVLPIRTEPLSLAEPLAAIGFPVNPQRQPALTVAAGHVEALSTDYAKRVDWIQVNFETGGGMSGAPVIDAYGSVVGIVAEGTYEATEDGVPARSFGQVLPIKYLLEIDPLAPPAG